MQLLSNLQSLSPSVQDGIREAAINEHCRRDPLYWLQRWTKTRDNHWREKGTEPYCKFPDKPYFPKLFELMASERRLFLPKSREMILSWAVVGYAVHLCQWNPNTQVIIQSQREAKSFDLVVGRGTPGYARVLYEQQDEFLKRLHPLTKAIDDMPADLISWKNDSSILGVPSGAAQVRQYHPAIWIMDEAAFLSEAAASYDTAEPVSSQIFVISSAGPSWFGVECMRVLEGARG
jgi:hypothetical protein